MRWTWIVLLFLWLTLVGCVTPAMLDARLKLALADFAKHQTQTGNGNRITDTDPWTTGIWVGGIVIVVGLAFGAGHWHRGSREQAKDAGRGWRH